MVLHWAFLLLGGWLAATVSGTAGFGGALLLLPVLVDTVGVRSAIPVLTVAQLLGNLSRAGFGWRQIHWRPALLFSAGAVPASIAGSRLFIELPTGLVLKGIGVFLLGAVGLRHTPLGKRPIAENLLAPAGVVVGFLSAVAGSAGPLGATVFLGLRLPPQAYVATEAVTAVFMHLTKSLVYGRYAALSRADLFGGLALGGSMMVGSWSGRKVIARLPEKRFDILVEILLLGCAATMIIGPF